MKISLCQIIAIFCLLSIGFITITLIIPSAEADSYTRTHYDVLVYYCEYGYNHYTYCSPTHLTIYHAQNVPHLYFIYTFTSHSMSCPIPSTCPALS